MNDAVLSLYDACGRRKYLTKEEGLDALRHAREAGSAYYPLMALLTYTGCRVSEALMVHPYHLEGASRRVVLRTLKRRKGKIVWRRVPIPPDVMDLLLSLMPPHYEGLLFGFNRQAAWRNIKQLLLQAGIEDGPHCCPKGFRHRFGVVAISDGINESTLGKWMGHSRAENTAIYLNVLGNEELELAQKMWPRMVLP